MFIHRKPITSKAEFIHEILKQEPLHKLVGTIAIPYDLILSGLNPTPIRKSGEEAVQLRNQELIDILEGKSDETEIYEVVQGKRGTLIAKKRSFGNATSYGIVTEAKTKLLEREIAMRQIASLPVRKNKRRSTTTSIGQ